MTIAERFWSKVDKKGPDDCWEWKAGKARGGYGKFWTGRNETGAHRYAWELHNKREIPDGMLVMHSCDNSGCVNPKHLRCGTESDNHFDMIQKKRGRRSWLSTAEILLVRGLKKFGFSLARIVCLAEVSEYQVRYILKSKEYPSREGAFV